MMTLEYNNYITKYNQLLKDVQLCPSTLTYFEKSENRHFGAFAFSLSGKKHLQEGKSCQDANCVKIVSENYHPTIIVSIANGIGDGSFPEFGASISAEAATNYLADIFSRNDISICEEKDIGDEIRNAMQFAVDKVNKIASTHELTSYSFYSTLTVAIYDGNDLYFGSVGNDGIYVLTHDGKIGLATNSNRNNKPGITTPLQAGKEKWQVNHIHRINRWYNNGN